MKQPGDMHLKEIQKEIEQRDDGPTIVGANQKIHLKIGQGKLSDGIIGGPGKIKIEYFDAVYARSDPLRFLLHHAEVEYEFVGHSFEKWGTIKAAGLQGEFGGLPRLTIDGAEFGQSMAQLRAMGSKYGYYDPTDWKTAYLCDVVIDCFVDIHDKTNGLTMKPPMMSPEGKDEDIKKIIETIHIPFLKLFENQLKTHGGKYAAGDKLTIADCCMVSVLVNIWENPAGPWAEKFKPVLVDYP